MNLSLILALILATILGLGGAGTAGYHKGKADAERAAKIAMSEHLAEDREAERVATEDANRYKDALATAQNAVSAAYEKGKADAEANAKRVVADLRAGNLVLRDRWTSCQASSGLPRPTPDTSEPDARTADRDESAGRIVQAAAQCDAQVKGLQSLLRLERQSQPEVGSHVGPLPD
jgi:Tfp pilus assembly protein PilX